MKQGVNSFRRSEITGQINMTFSWEEFCVLRALLGKIYGTNSPEHELWEEFDVIGDAVDPNFSEYFNELGDWLTTPPSRRGARPEHG